MAHNLARPVYKALNSALAIDSLSSEDRTVVLRLIDDVAAVAGLRAPALDTSLGMRECMRRLKLLLTQAEAVLTKYQRLAD